MTHAFWNKSGFGKFLESFWKKNLPDMNAGDKKNRQLVAEKNISLFLINNIVSASLEDCNILKFLIFGQQNHSILRLF